MASSSSPPSLEALPREALKHVLLFLGNVPDFLSCEKTCKKFHSVISDDSLWQALSLKRCPQDFDLRVQTHREAACIKHNLRLHKLWAVKSTQNILLLAFEEGTACAQWKTIVLKILEHFLPPELSGNKHKYFLRGDTMGTLIDFLESYLIHSFQRAMLVCATNLQHYEHLFAVQEYPTLTTHHFKLQDGLGQNHGCQTFMRDFTADQIAWALSLIDTEKREMITRRAGLRAGVIKQDNDISILAWTSLVHVIAELFRPACEELVLYASYQSISSATKKRSLSAPACGWSIRSVPPLSTPLAACPDRGEHPLLHTPVPRQIEEAAARLLPTFPTKTYNFWLTDEGEWWTPDSSDTGFPAEYEAALAEYDFVVEEHPELKRQRIADSGDEHSFLSLEYTDDEIGVNDDQSTDSLLDLDSQNGLDDDQSTSGSEGDDDDRSSASSESRLLSAPSDDEEDV